MAKKDKVQDAEQQQGTKEPTQSTAELYSMENLPTIEDFTSGPNQVNHRQDLEDEQADAEDKQADARGGRDQGQDLSSETEVPESSEDPGASLFNPVDPQAGRLQQRAEDAGLLPDYSSAPSVFDEAAGIVDPVGYAGMGNGLISQTEPTGGYGYATGYDKEEGLQKTDDKTSGDNWLYDFAETLSAPFIPGKTDYGPTNQEFRRLEQEESGGTGGDAGSSGDAGSGGDAGGSSGSDTGGENEESITRTNPDGTVDVVKGDKMYHWDPKTNEVTERNLTTGETTTTSPDTGLFGQPDPDNEGTDLSPGLIDPEILLPPELRTESILQNMTGVGPKGGEAVNPTREGGTEQSGSYATDVEFTGIKGQTTEELIGQHDPDATQHGGRPPGSAPIGPGQDEIDPGEDGILPPGETRTEDFPADTTSSQDDSFGLEGGIGGGFDLTHSAEQIQDARDLQGVAPPALPYDTSNSDSGGGYDYYANLDLSHVNWQPDPTLDPATFLYQEEDYNTVDDVGS